MTRLQLEQAVRGWLVLAGAAGGIPNADRAVILGDRDGTRPPLPYLMVRVLTPEVTVGEDEVIVGGATPTTISVRGQRYGTVSVQAFGDGAETWLRRALRKLSAPSVLAYMQEAGASIRPEGGIQNLSGLRDSHTEVRFAQDVRVAFEVVSPEDEQEAGVELLQVVNAHEWTSEAGEPDRSETVTINL